MGAFFQDPSREVERNINYDYYYLSLAHVNRKSSNNGELVGSTSER